jgi:hypothetical protein
MGCCETKTEEHKHEHCGKEMEKKEGKYSCSVCGYEEECSEC